MSITKLTESAHTFRPALLTGVAGLVAAVWAMAVLTPQHFFPVSSFYQELGMAAAVLLAGIVLAVGSGTGMGLTIPWAALPFLGLSAVVLPDIALRKVTYPDAMLWPLGSLLVAALAAVIGAQWKAHGQAERLMRAWSWAFVIGALGTATIMWVQLFEPNVIALWLFPRSPLQAPMGNIAQRNQAALILGFGLLALGYFARASAPHRTWRFAAAIPLALLLISGIALSQSRIGLAFLAVAALCVGMTIAPPSRRWMGALLGLLSAAIAYGALQWLIYTGFGLGQLFPPGLQRLADRGIGQRLGLWSIAWQAFRDNPLLGAGIGSFATWDYRLALDQAQPLFANNAHNLIAQLAAETGLIGLLVAFAPAIISVARAWRDWVRSGVSTFEPWRFVALGVCVMTMGYSLTEYPLWYVFYAVPFAMCWAVLDAPALVIRPSRELRALFVIAALSALSFSAWAAQRYASIAEAASVVFLSNGKMAPSKKLNLALHGIANSPGFSAYVDAFVFAQMSADRFMLPDKIELGRRVVTTLYGPQLIAKLATLYGVAHKPEMAARNFARICAYFPDDCTHAAENLHALQKQNAKDFDPVAAIFFNLPQSGIRPRNVNLLRPWDHHSDGTVITIDSAKTIFGFNLAAYASGLAQIGMKSGKFLATPTEVDTGAQTVSSANNTPHPEK